VLPALAMFGQRALSQTCANRACALCASILVALATKKLDSQPIRPRMRVRPGTGIAGKFEIIWNGVAFGLV